MSRTAIAKAAQPRHCAATLDAPELAFQAPNDLPWGTAAMDRSVFNRFCDVARRHAGLEFSDAKLALIAARVAKRVRALGLSSEEEYVEYLEQAEDSDELVRFLDAVTTNYTTFFREPDHFELLTNLLRRRRAAGETRIRIWCAASATGEEPYTLAITALEALEPRATRTDVKILATDISTRALSQAMEGSYEATRLTPIPAELKAKYFSKIDGRYHVKDFVKSLVVFKRLNLAHTPFPMAGPLEAIFCRNVIMYLGEGVRQRMVLEFQRLIREDGIIVVGHAESLTGLDTLLRVIKPSAYSLVGKPSKKAG